MGFNAEINQLQIEADSTRETIISRKLQITEADATIAKL